VFLFISSPAIAGEPLASPYARRAAHGFSGLSDKEIGELEAGTGMGLARVAELNSYPGPRHVLDAVAAGQLAASAEQVARVQRVFDGMRSAAQRVGVEILAEERALDAAFRMAAITEADLQARTGRIAALRGELRAIHLAAHLSTRAILSDAQIARYDELRGYAAPGASAPHEHKH
jgi:hypothetical protein